MTPRPILTASAMRAAEDRAIAAGTPVDVLMERAGCAVAEAAWRFAAAAPALILCGPGNNGGDGYVAARFLAARGVAVRVAASGEPRTGVARAARAAWNGPVEPLDGARPAGLLIDCLFGTGLARPLDPAMSGALARLAEAARLRIAVDLPSGVATDDGAMLSPVPCFDLTLALGALKPAHLLQPSARWCGRFALADIGLGAIASDLVELARPSLPPPGPDDHKYSRGMVAVAAGAMPGAASLCASAAQHAGAGYVVLAGGGAGGPLALVHRTLDAETLGDPRIGAIVAGPGLGRDAEARRRLALVLRSKAPLVLDADALTLLAEDGVSRLRRLPHTAILTPHAGEFARLFGEMPGSKVDRARAAAEKAQAVVILKGADTVIAAPDGRAAIQPATPAWLASAGTGDVLAGVVGAMRARGLDAFDAACAGAWLHGEAARRAGPALIADDLAAHLPAALAACG